MFLKTKYLNELFEKIAQSITKITQSGSLNKSALSSSENKNTFKPSNNKSLDLQSTISKARDKADLQPLHRNTGIVYKPADRLFASKMRNKQEYLGDIEDKRITYHHLRNR